MITSAFSAASLALFAALPPASSSAGGTGLMSESHTSWPPLIRWPAIGAPMMPSPMNPIFMFVSLSAKLLHPGCA